MALVTYSNSEDESDVEALKSEANTTGTSQKSKKRKRGNSPQLCKTTLPPLPSTFHSLYATSTRTHPSDDPALHAGRTRQIPHVEGNWPTHIYLEWYPSHTKLNELQKIIDNVNTTSTGTSAERKLHSHLRSDLGAQLPLHISLSAPLVLQTEQKSIFEETLEKVIKESGLRPFEVCVKALDWTSNFDETRFFLVLRLEKPANDELNKLLSICNGFVARHELPLLYSGKSSTVQNGAQAVRTESGKGPEGCSEAFHISIAWQLTEPSLVEKSAVKQIDLSQLLQNNVSFDVVKLKVGNMVKDIDLVKHSKS